MEQESNSDLLRPWDALLPELLVLVFSNSSLQEKLTVLPLVCKSWKRLVSSPCLWLEIEIDLMVEWAKERDPADVYRFLARLFSLCSPMCLPKKLSISGAGLEEFPLITRYAENLTTLKIPWSFIANETVIREARKLSSLRFLDLSYTYGIGARAIEAIGKHCRLLTGFRRYMLLDFKDHYYDDEARAIAATMHGLKSLEINHFKFISHTSVLKILSSCTKLDYLDLRQSYIIGPGEKLPQYFSSRTLQKCSGRYDVFIR